MGLLPLIFFCLIAFSNAEVSSNIGINYGLLGNNLPSPSRSMKLIKKLKADTVKLYEPELKILKALTKTDFDVAVMVPNQIISNISSNQTLANEWVKTNLVPFYPKAKIRTLFVGNEIFSYYTDVDKQTWLDLLPAMRRLKYSLKIHKLQKVKLGTTCAMDVLQSSFPPSNGTFRPDLALPVMKPLLQFLNKTRSFFFIDSYPFFAWIQNYPQISLDYALFRGGSKYTDPVSGLTYTNLLDQMLDSVIFAMSRLGFPKVRLAISETGWPNGGDLDQFGTSPYNAAVYNRNLIKRMTAKPAIGTPARPGVYIPTTIFALYNENQKGGQGTEKHWGVYYPNGTAVYEVDLSGETPLDEYKSVPRPTNNEPYKGKIWCVTAKEAKENATTLAGAVKYACSQGNGTCDAIDPTGDCYEPVSLVQHANYAFNSYWVQFRSSGGTCYFNGLATQTTKDPSHGSCKFPSVIPANGTSSI